MTTDALTRRTTNWLRSVLGTTLLVLGVAIAGHTTANAAAVGDFVWNDLNGNGIQDSGEPAIDGVTVRLLNSGGTVIATTTTFTGSGVFGFYQFSGLLADMYELQFDLPSGFSFTLPNQGGNDALDSDVANLSTGSTGLFTLATDEDNRTIDAGMCRTSDSSCGIRVPEPGSLALLGLGLAGLAASRRRKQ